MPFVSITCLRARSWRYLPPFLIAALRSSWQARRTKGNLALSVLRDAHNAFWTCSLWTDKAAMTAFLTASAHRAAMPKLPDWCDEAHVVHWKQDFDQEPSWEEAHQRMQHEGRASKVKYPSSGHSSFQLPVRRIGRGGDIRFR